jgi:hypothetical protein
MKTKWLAVAESLAFWCGLVLLFFGAFCIAWDCMKYCENTLALLPKGQHAFDQSEVSQASWDASRVNNLSLGWKIILFGPPLIGLSRVLSMPEKEISPFRINTPQNRHGVGSNYWKFLASLVFVSGFAAILFGILRMPHYSANFSAETFRSLEKEKSTYTTKEVADAARAAGFAQLFGQAGLVVSSPFIFALSRYLRHRSTASAKLEAP